jgi:hypothetical protein
VSVELLDLSNYDSDLVTIRSRIDCLREEHGVKYAIVGCQFPSVAREIIAALQAGGISTVGVYAFLYWGRWTLSETNNAIAVARN